MNTYRRDSTAFKDDPLVLGAASSSIVMTLAYFSLFQHPLLEEELLTYSHFYAISREDALAAIRSLVARGILETHDGLLCLHGEGALARIRAERVARAAPWHQKSLRSIQVLSRLPFLRGLFISGSLSKGTQDPNGDIDFLLLTAPNRLWTARFFASLLLKLMPRSHRCNYCLNYFLPEGQLEIPDRTLFSATEVAFLKPVLNARTCAAFFEQNTWTRTFYPNWQPPTGPPSAPPSSVFQRAFEWPLAGHLGNLFESWISRWYENRLRTMSQLLPPKAAADFRYGPSEYKGHNKGRHDQIRQRWVERVNGLEADLGICLIRWSWTLRASWKPLPRPLRSQRAREQFTRRLVPLKITGWRLQPTL